MAILSIRSGPLVRQISFDAPQALSTLLQEADAAIAHPCGGRGVCGKCAVVLFGDVSSPSATELRLGLRLSCQAVITGDAEVILPAVLPMEQIDGGSALDLSPSSPMQAVSAQR